MIKTILVPVNGSDADLATFRAALSIARPFASHIEALHVRVDPVEVVVAMTADAGSGALSSGFIESLERQADAYESAARRNFEQFFGQERVPTISTPAEAGVGPSAQWHVETGQQPHWLTVCGMTADLIVATRNADADAGGRATLETLLLDTGRPLLIAGTTAPLVGTPEVIAIAWKPTPQAVRAVALAMPFLVRAKKILVMSVDEGEDTRDQADRLVRNLAWRGLDAVAQSLAPEGKGAADTLLAAASADCGLLIMGGYGHNRIREWVFGGFTERVLSAATLPVLMAH